VERLNSLLFTFYFFGQLLAQRLDLNVPNLLDCWPRCRAFIHHAAIMTPSLGATNILLDAQAESAARQAAGHNDGGEGWTQGGRRREV
jgi:hypothetical protein